MADYRATSTEFTAVADAIRTKGGTSAQLTWPNGFVSAVQAIPTGGGGSTNILKGLSKPTASIGDNGSIYLQYVGNNPFYPLPTDATPLTYIKNSANQYIRTGYNGLDNSEYTMTFRYDEDQTARYPIPFGGRRYSSALGDCAYAMLGNEFNQAVDGISWGSNQYIPALSIGSAQLIGKILTIELSKGNYKITFDGEDHSYTFTPSAIGSGTIDCGIFTGIFGNAYNSMFDSQNMRMYDFEIRESGNLVHKYVPCLDPNDVPCVYDYVTEEYLYNAGTGNFTYGTDESIIMAYCKVNGVWQPLIGTDINDVNLGGN